MTYYLWIIGCQYNEWDGARLKYFFNQNELTESSASDADIIIILACAVRQTAVDRILGRVKNWKNKTILVAGCVLNSDKKKFIEKGIKFFESGNFETLKKYLDISFARTNNYQLKTINSCYVPIVTGCDNFCSYCVVPYVRGREKSRPANEIIKDVKTLIENGHKNITLLGQNVNSYKSQTRNLKSKNGQTDFANLLIKLNDLEGDFKIGFVSSHPKDMSNDIIEAVGALQKIKKEIHLPFQSGSNKILKLMNRPYTIEQYLNIVQNLKFKIKNLKLTTDVIVGFPGETEDDFEKTVAVFKKVKFAQAYINKYSPRAGTTAYKLGDPIPWSEKQRRWRILNEIVNH